MKISKSELRQIIKEEIQGVVDEGFPTGEEDPWITKLNQVKAKLPPEVAQEVDDLVRSAPAAGGGAQLSHASRPRRPAGGGFGKSPFTMEEGEEEEGDEEKEELSPDEGGPSGTSAPGDKRSREELTGDI